jgi:hypothetical protein
MAIYRFPFQELTTLVFNLENYLHSLIDMLIKYKLHISIYSENKTQQPKVEVTTITDNPNNKDAINNIPNDLNNHKLEVIFIIFVIIIPQAIK